MNGKTYAFIGKIEKSEMNGDELVDVQSESDLKYDPVINALDTGACI